MGSSKSKMQGIDGLDMGRNATLRKLVFHRNPELTLYYKKDTKTYTTRHSELRHDKAYGGFFL